MLKDTNSPDPSREYTQAELDEMQQAQDDLDFDDIDEEDDEYPYLLQCDQCHQPISENASMMNDGLCGYCANGL